MQVLEIKGPKSLKYYFKEPTSNKMITLLYFLIFFVMIFSFEE